MALRALEKAKSKEVVKERILQYANDCLIDKILSCQAHKDACARLIRDFVKSQDKSYAYYWDEKEAEDIIVWFSLFNHTKGDLAGTPIHLMPAQQFHICQLFGWRRKKDGKRRFKKMYLQEARKNGKSQEESIICLHEIAITSMQYGEMLEVYTAGPKRQQSRLVFEECVNVLKQASPELRRKFKVMTGQIVHIKSGSFIRPLSKDDGKTGDGTNIHMLCLDERHQMPTNEFAALFYGAGSSDPLMVSITTSGMRLDWPCFKEYEFCKKILSPNSDLEDDEYLIDIYELEPGDYADVRNVTDESLWIKANPVRATFDKGLEAIRREYKEALEKPEDLPAALTKLFNIWYQYRESGYMDMEKWKACQVDEFPIDIHGMECIIGADMSAKIDLTAIAILIKYQDPEKKDLHGNPVIKYIVIQHSFIPNRDRLIERVNKDKAPYDAWEAQGYLSVTNTDIVDKDYVIDWTYNFIKKYNLRPLCWAFDANNAAGIMSDVGKKYTVYDVAQNYPSLNDATVGFREEVYCGNIVYTYDPLLNFAMGNAVVKKSNGLIKVDKDATTQRIDPVDAILCAFKLSKYFEAAISQKEYNSMIDNWLASDW